MFLLKPTITVVATPLRLRVLLGALFRDRPFLEEWIRPNVGPTPLIEKSPSSRQAF